jgi:hypothetical protein
MAVFFYQPLLPILVMMKIIMPMMRATKKIPVHMPALKIPSTSSQLDSRKTETTAIKERIEWYVFMLIVFKFNVCWFNM